MFSCNPSAHGGIEQLGLLISGFLEVAKTCCIDKLACLCLYRAAAGVLLGLPALLAPSAFAELLTGIPGDPEPEKFKPGDSPAKERRAALDKTAREIKQTGVLSDTGYSGIAPIC